ncbi:MAG TPA: hypothetical protein GX694_05385 [Actinomycetales bacterium]|nr:hypothetical protein [Actinomycetales bacterium]
MRRLGAAAAKRLALEILGWTLVVLGIAALFLPGPGLLTLFAGMVVLSQQYPWFEKRVDPVKRLALEGASKGVQTWPRVTGSLLGIAGLAGVGVLWGEHPPAPAWWPFDPEWWFPGGWGAGVSFLLSAALGLGLLIYSINRFHGRPYDHALEQRRERVRHARIRLEKEERRLAQEQHGPASGQPGLTPG